MRRLYYILGVGLLGAGALMVVNDQNANMPWSIIETIILVFGGILVNRWITNRPLFPSSLETQKMLANAREKWVLGTTVAGLFILSLTFLALGTHQHFSYAETHP
jgi:hypothetical protein